MPNGARDAIGAFTSHIGDTRGCGEGGIMDKVAGVSHSPLRGNGYPGNQLHSRRNGAQVEEDNQLFLGEKRSRANPNYYGRLRNYGKRVNDSWAPAKSMDVNTNWANYVR